MLGNSVLLPRSGFGGHMRELSIDEIDLISGNGTATTVAVVAGAISGVAWGVAEVAAIVPGGQGVAAVAGVVAGVSGAVAGVAGAIAYFG